MTEYFMQLTTAPIRLSNIPKALILSVLKISLQTILIINITAKKIKTPEEYSAILSDSPIDVKSGDTCIDKKSEHKSAAMTLISDIISYAKPLKNPRKMATPRTIKKAISILSILFLRFLCKGIKNSCYFRKLVNI